MARGGCQFNPDYFGDPCNDGEEACLTRECGLIQGKEKAAGRICARNLCTHCVCVAHWKIFAATSAPPANEFSGHVLWLSRSPPGLAFRDGRSIMQITAHKSLSL